MIQKLLNLGQNNSQRGAIEIHIIGDRAAGKTTYLAALAYWPISLKSKESPILRVEPFDQESRVLLEMAENILLQGDELPASEEPVSYRLTIDLKQDFVDKLTKKPPQIRVSCIDYPGEFFKNLGTNSSIINSYLNALETAAGLLFLIDVTGRDIEQKDKDYAKSIKQLEVQLNRRLAGTPQRLKDYRIAVVVSKAELPELWGKIDNDISDFLNRSFPYTQDALNDWQNQWKCQIQYFSCSAFGWMGTRGEPNVKRIQRGNTATKAIINDPNVWKPRGLVQPIFWLRTGHHHSKLRSQNF